MQLFREPETSTTGRPCVSDTQKIVPNPQRQSRLTIIRPGAAERQRTEERLKGDDAWRHGEGLAHGQTLLAVDEEGVVLDGQVGFQGGLGAQQLLQGVLGVAQLGLQGLHGVCDLTDLLNQPEDITKSTCS